MRTKLAFAVLSLAATISAQDYPEVSRAGKNLLLLTEVTTPGFATPKVLYNKVKNATDEPKYKDYLTALGKRQQYIVGGEYRLRYVEEASFLNYSYDITQLWIQTTFDSKNILSAQAQLHGLYPPSTNINFLTEW
jgi:acid phosphatase